MHIRGEPPTQEITEGRVSSGRKLPELLFRQMDTGRQVDTTPLQGALQAPQKEEGSGGNRLANTTILYRLGCQDHQHSLSLGGPEQQWEQGRAPSSRSSVPT